VSAAPQRSGYDALVIGAGLVGLACAWRAAQRGLSVLVIDRDGPAAGASSAAAGMLAPVTEADFGAEALLHLNLASAKLWPAFADELGAELHYVRPGALVVAADRDDAEELRRLHAFQRQLGLDADWLTPSECRRLEPGLATLLPDKLTSGPHSLWSVDGEHVGTHEPCHQLPDRHMYVRLRCAQGAGMDTQPACALELLAQV